MKWAEWLLSVLLIVVLVISCSNKSAHAGIKVYADTKTSNDYITFVETIDKNNAIIVRNWK